MPSITPNLRLSITNRETNKPFLNWRLGIDGPDDSNMIKLDKAWGDMKTMVDGAMAAVGHAYTAATAADMTDHDKSYVYVGSETGYTNGNWYYWNEDQSAWVSGGVYNATALQTDDTLTLEGEAADAKATGEMIVINGTSSNGTRINITTTNEDVVIPTMDDVDDLKTQLNAEEDTREADDVTLQNLITAEKNRAESEEARIEALFTDPVEDAVADWLSEHPEYMTTVEDGSLTELKFADSLKLLAIKDYVTPEMYGAEGDGVADDTNAIVLAIASGKPVVMPNNYYITDTVTIDGGKYLRAFGKIIYGGLRTKPAIKVTGQYNDVNLNTVVDTASNAYNTLDGGWHGWADDNYSGVELFNCYYSKVFVNRIINFTCGLKMTADGANSPGNFNNSVSGKLIQNCKYAIYFWTGGSGWMNTNVISGFTMSMGSRGTDIYTNSLNITTYGVYQDIEEGTTYGLNYTTIKDLCAEVVTKSTYVEFYFKLAHKIVIENIVTEIDNNATFALFDITYTATPVSTDNQHSAFNEFRNIHFMGGNSQITYHNPNESLVSLENIAKFSDTKWYECFYDDKFGGSSLALYKNQYNVVLEGSIRGYSFSALNSVDNADINKYPRTTSGRTSNVVGYDSVSLPTSRALSLLIPVNYGDTFRVKLTGTNANNDLPNSSLKTFDSNKNIIKPNESVRGLCGFLGYNTDKHFYNAKAKNLNDYEFSIVDQNIKYVMLLITGVLHSIEIQKAKEGAIIFRHWGGLEFANYLGYDKFMSDTMPNSIADNETAYVGQRVYKVTSVSTLGQYWELTANGWVDPFA